MIDGASGWGSSGQQRQQLCWYFLVLLLVPVQVAVVEVELEL